MKDYSYIVCPNNVKEKLLKDLSKDGFNIHVKFITKQELLKNVYFDYDYRAIQYIHDKYNCHFDNAKEIIDNLYNIKTGTEKLNNLVDIYNDLCEKKLLKFNKLFYLTFKGYSVYVMGYSKEDIELKSALDKLNLSYEYIINESTIYPHRVTTFNTIEDEVLYVFNEIGSLVEKGVSLNNIYFYSIPSEYELLIRKYSSYYKIPIEGVTSHYLYDSPIYKKFTSLLVEHGYKEAYRLVEEETKYDSLDVLSRLISILVELSPLNLDKEDLLPILNYAAKNKTLRNTLYKEAISVCNDHSIINDNDHVFMLGFSLGVYPVINRDTDYLTDIEKESINRNTSSILNTIARTNLVNFINSTKNLTITFKEKLNKQEYYVSLLQEDLGMEKIKGSIGKVRYSKELAMLETANYKDLYSKYHMVSKYLDEFANEIEYKTYSHLFNGIEPLKDNYIELSYTQINEYYQCAFKFFVKRILNANIFEDSFAIKVGDVFHKMLEDVLVKDIDVDKDYNDLINKRFTTNQELFFFNLLKPQIKDVITKLKDFHRNSEYTKIIGEHKFKYKIDDNTFIVGKADKLMIDEKENKAMVVDYKTNDSVFKPNLVKHGLNLQLPLYATLLKDEFPDLEVSGLFLQNILADKREIEDKDNIDKLYKTAGLYTDDLYTFRRMDTLVGTETDENGKTINDSKFIKGAGITSKKTVKGSVKKATFNELIDTAHNKVIEANEAIRNSNFTINPKGENMDKLPCRYCECFDICFKKNSDIVILKNDSKEGK